MFAVLEDVKFVQDLALILLVAGIFGWVARLLKLSSIVGYLIGGLLLSPHNSPIELVEDTGRIHTLAQIGLISILFHIGLDFSIRKLRRLGFHMIVANLVAAVIIFSALSSTGGFLGWPEPSRIFIGAMFMISSSAIIIKVLKELGISHEKPSQMAMGLVIIEDALVVILLTLLAAYVQFNDIASAPLTSTIGLLSAFILILLAFGFFFVPRLLKTIRRQTNAELTVILVCALLFGISVISVKAGFSLALGAFLLGAVIADTPAKPQLDRWLSGAHSLLTAIFFTAIGMLVNLSLIPSVWKLILLFSVLVLLLRFGGYALGLLIAGVPTNHALRAGLIVTPVGEFSFVMAGLGIESGTIPETFYSIAIGVCFVTSFIAPLLTREAEQIAVFAEKRQPAFTKKSLSFYHRCLDWLCRIQNRSVVWRLSRKRLLQILREFGIVTAIVLFSRPLFRWIEGDFGPDLLFEQGTVTLFVLVGTVLAIAPLLSLWRNMSALGLLYAEALTPRRSQATPAVRRLLSGLFNVLGLIVIAFWIGSILPLTSLTLWGLGLFLTLIIILTIGLRRQLVRLHSKFEISLEEAVGTTFIRTDQKLNYLLDPHQEWDLEIIECEIPDDSPHAGKPIETLGIRTRFGASLVGIDRHGFIMGNPRAEDTLFPGDRVLLLGTLSQIKQTREFLTRREFTDHQANFDDITLDQVDVPAGCRHCGVPLETLHLPAQFQIQLLGLKRDGHPRLNLQGSDSLKTGDRLLVLGTPDQVAKFRLFLEPENLSVLDHDG